MTLIAAMARNRVIGRDNALPWHLPEDLRRFKALTLGKPVLMGRRTHESIGRALPGRDNLVITRRRDYRAPGCTLYRSLEAALRACAGGEAMVIGGAEIYAQSLPLARRMHLTLIDADIAGDARFPDFDEGDWRETYRVELPADVDRAFGVCFLDLERVTVPDGG